MVKLKVVIKDNMDEKLEVKLVPGMVAVFINMYNGRFNVIIDDRPGWGFERSVGAKFCRGVVDRVSVNVGGSAYWGVVINFGAMVDRGIGEEVYNGVGYEVEKWF